MISNLDELFAPLGAGRFFAEHYEKGPLHLPANSATTSPLLTHDDLLRAIEVAANNPSRAEEGSTRPEGGKRPEAGKRPEDSKRSEAGKRPEAGAHPEAGTRPEDSARLEDSTPPHGNRTSVPEGLVLFPEHAGTTSEELVADPARMRAYLAAGHPLVWNRARGVSPAVDALAALLAETFGARVWPNVYATGEAGTPFDVHFDAHEVIAIQCEGEKRWWFSEVRVDRPLDAPEMEPAIAAALRTRRDEAAARTLHEWTARPGDLVYIPRGQFHNARALHGRSLHVTFGIRLPSGFELAQVVVRSLLADPLMREILPPAASDPEGMRTAALAEEIAARIRGALGPDDVLAASREVRARWVG